MVAKFRDERQRNCASSLSPSSTEDDLSLSPLRSILPRIEESSFTNWLANESPNNTSAFQANNRIHEADEALLNGFNGLNISCNSSIPESRWVRNSKPENKAKSYVKRNWVLDDYGSFIWTPSNGTSDEIEIPSNQSENFEENIDQPRTSSCNSNLFCMNDWLVVVEDGQEDIQNKDNSTDDGSSIVVLNMYE